MLHVSCCTFVLLRTFALPSSDVREYRQFRANSARNLQQICATPAPLTNAPYRDFWEPLSECNFPLRFADLVAPNRVNPLKLLHSDQSSHGGTQKGCNLGPCVDSQIRVNRLIKLRIAGLGRFARVVRMLWKDRTPQSAHHPTKAMMNIVQSWGWCIFCCLLRLTIRTPPPRPFQNFSGISSGKSQPYWGCGPTTSHIARYVLREGSAPPKWCDPLRWYLLSHRHTWAIAHFATYRAKNCAIPPKKQVRQSFAMLSLQAMCDMKSIVAGPLRLARENYLPPPRCHNFARSRKGYMVDMIFLCFPEWLSILDLATQSLICSRAVVVDSSVFPVRVDRHPWPCLAESLHRDHHPPPPRSLSLSLPRSLLDLSLSFPL